MDIRKEKTLKGIKNAFLELRSRKPIEKITIKELCNLAQINKSTFYSHFDDIYALSECMQTETVAYILNTLSQSRDTALQDHEQFTYALFEALNTHYPLISTLFSGKEQSYLADRLEEGIKEMQYRLHPEYRDDPQKQVLLTFAIHGGYHAYLKNQQIGGETLIRMIGNISQQLQPLY